MVEEKYVDTRFGEVCYQTCGEGKNILVFLHGFLGEPEFVEKTWHKIGHKDYRVVAPYLPGHGKSFMVPSGYLFSDLVSTMEEWLQKILGEKYSGKVVLVGHSLGGAISWEITARRKIGPKTVVLLDPGLGHLNRSVLKRVLNYFRELRYDFARHPFKKSIEFIFKHPGSGNQILHLASMVKMIESVRRMEIKRLPGDILIHAWWGDNDMITPFKEYEPILKTHKNIKIKLFPGAHHWFMHLIERYLDELEGVI